MKKFEGTKSPWSFHQTMKGNYKVSGTDWSNFCKVYTILGSEPGDDEYIQAEANAKLIAAAPLLLKSCIDVFLNTTNEADREILRYAISKATD